MIDFLVVGSGPSAVHVAQTLLDSDAHVTMLDAGVGKDRATRYSIPDQPWTELRKNDSDQYRYFLGADYSGIPLGKIKAGSGLSTPRRFVTEKVGQWVENSSDTGFNPVESLAFGGLGGAWGLGCFTMSDAELDLMGISKQEMRISYQRVADRIGISAGDDTGSLIYRSGLSRLLPALEIDESSDRLLARYDRVKNELNQKRLYLGRTMLALLSKDFDGRRACRYQDMEFWTDLGQSAYRPAISLERMIRNPRFQYISGAIALSYRGNTGEPVTLEYVDINSHDKKQISARKLILAAGVLGTARIVLRSTSQSASLPILCNPYYYVLCLRPGLIGLRLRERRHSMGQLVLSYDETGDGSHVPIASLLSYRSLLIFRLIKEAPLSFRESHQIMRILAPAFTIAGVFHPDGYPDGSAMPTDSRRMSLRPNTSVVTGDELRITLALSDSEKNRVSRNQAAILSGLRKLGAFPLRSVDPGLGASIHYGGTLPFSQEVRPCTVDPRTSRIHGNAEVYVADGSAFRFVPAKGITLSLMAYADWVGRRLARS